MAASIGYVDEAGTPVGGETGSDQFFVITATVLSEDDAGKAQQWAKKLANASGFPNGSLKSSRIGSSTSRRLEVLRAIVGEFERSRYRAISLRVDKSLLYGPGLRVKRTAFKYLHKTLSKVLFETLPHLTLVLDRYGTSEYQRSFQDYLMREFASILWDQRSVRHAQDDGECALVAISDFIAGTLRRRRMGEDADRAEEIDELVRRLGDLRDWPSPLAHQESGSDVKRDACIRNTSSRLAEHVLQSLDLDNSPQRQQYYVLRRLLAGPDLGVASDDWIHAEELIDHLMSYGYDRIPDSKLRRTLIAKLRDRGVAIVSSARGYKLATSEKDVRLYFRRARANIVPHKERLRDLNTRIAQATREFDSLDLLSEDEFRHLRLNEDPDPPYTAPP